ncbi:hypothetical protein XENOCAPTIV_020473 [Xenoophorus captivus]|uniref:Transmembrane protein n=1 Tax=Xenoophorus captivus TaxID=1517983 RepID=A0ABV0SJ64_9TELE
MTHKQVSLRVKHHELMYRFIFFLPALLLTFFPSALGGGGRFFSVSCTPPISALLHLCVLSSFFGASFCISSKFLNFSWKLCEHDALLPLPPPFPEDICGPAQNFVFG